MNRKIYILLTVLLAWSFSLKAQTAQIGSQTAIPGASVSFDIDVAALPANVGAVSLFIGYDPNVLAFTGSVGDQLTGYVLNNMIGTNQIGIQWTNPSGDDINGTLLTLNFQYSTLGGSCDITFNPGCEFADILLNSITVIYANGTMGPDDGIPTVTIDEKDATAGPVSLAVTGAGFTKNAGAITLFIDFDPGILTFTGFTSPIPIMLNVNPATGRINVAYSSTIGYLINGPFLNLNFNYNGTGSSELVFVDKCEITETDMTPIIVSYDNGLVKPLSNSYQLTIEDVADALPGNAVGVDITAAGFPTNIGAITLNVGYNPAHLTFLNLSSGTISGVYANVVSPGLLKIIWTNYSGQNINGVIFTMNFDYHFGASAITFEGGCDIADVGLNPIPTTYNDGSISPVDGGPEVRLPLKTGTVGQTIDFPVTAKTFDMKIAAISLFIGIDSDVLTYTGSTPGTISGYYINYMSATSQIGAMWSAYPEVDINPNNPDDDTLFTLHFTYNGGVSDLTFDAGCEFAQGDLTTAPVSYFDGMVFLAARFNIKAFLEGPFSADTMSTTLRDSLYVPLTQPYNVAPWNYAGTESVAAIPANVVDWVLLEFRETTGAAITATSSTVVARQAAFILKNGSIVRLDGINEVLVPTLFTDNVYVVIYHRNHLSMMSSVAVPLAGNVYTYDFTTAITQAYLSGQKLLPGGFGGMYAADGNGDGQVSLNDLFFVWMVEDGLQGYYAGDFDLNTNVQLYDLFFMWMPNDGAGTQVP